MNEGMLNMTRAPHIQPTATCGHPQWFGNRIELNNRALKALPSQGRVGRGFFGAERVSSRIGGGMSQALVDPLNTSVTPVTDPPNYSLIIEDQARMLQRQISCVEMNPSYVVMESQFHSVEQSTQMADPEDNWYIYHSDHLGSSAFLTDASGTPIQHLQYLPFGESFIDQRSITDYNTPYTFSAKERDLETGYSYFGARYYDATISIRMVKRK
jgi:hypothetical protein